MTRLLALRLLWLVAAGALAEPAPAPARVPKVYNALITSNQNLEPSKAYPVYQPVIHDTAFAYPFQPAIFYGGEFSLSNGLVPPLTAPKPQQPNEAPQPPPDSADEDKDANVSPTETPPTPAPAEDGGKQGSPAPPSPPSTQSPIPLNQFGLPPQVLPLGRYDPAYNGFTQVAPFTYNFPGFRFYDPYDPFGFSPYANLPPPVYRPLTNVLSQSPPAAPRSPVAPLAPSPVPTVQTAGESTPPPEPSDLNLLNYSSKDPAIPNVPPPPLPSGGLKSDSSD